MKSIMDWFKGKEKTEDRKRDWEERNTTTCAYCNIKAPKDPARHNMKGFYWAYDRRKYGIPVIVCRVCHEKETH